MKKCKFLALVLSALLLVGMLVSCSGSGTETEVTLILQIATEDTPMFEQTITVDAENPTVDDIISEAALSYGLALEWTELDALSMADYPDQLNDDGTYDMWICEINGSETQGRARETEVKAGDKIVYTYTHYTPEEEK